MMSNNICQLWCTQCGIRIVEDGILRQCPSCGTTATPCDPVNDVAIEINWHELRVLGIWASNWANEKCKDDPRAAKSLHAILTRIQRQHPHKSALTMFGEIAALRDEYDVTTNKPLRTEIVPVNGDGAIGHTKLAELEAENARLREAARWIPVSERLPEDAETVLVAGGCAYYQSGDGWFTLMGSDAHRRIQWKVTHWMPLPTQPDSEQENGDD